LARRSNGTRAARGAAAAAARRDRLTGFGIGSRSCRAHRPILGNASNPAANIDTSTRDVDRIDPFRRYVDFPPFFRHIGAHLSIGPTCHFKLLKYQEIFDG
jgi:hypothetical protein